MKADMSRPVLFLSDITFAEILLFADFLKMIIYWPFGKILKCQIHSGKKTTVLSLYFPVNIKFILSMLTISVPPVVKQPSSTEDSDERMQHWRCTMKILIIPFHIWQPTEWSEKKRILVSVFIDLVIPPSHRGSVCFPASQMSSRKRLHFSCQSTELSVSLENKSDVQIVEYYKQLLPRSQPMRGVW